MELSRYLGGRPDEASRIPAAIDHTLTTMPRRQPRYSLPACEPALLRDARRATGVYYTPPEIVRQIVDLTLGPLLDANCHQPLQILDPACGAGEFLVEAQRRLHAHCVSSATAAHGVQGIDVDASAVTSARRRLSDRDETFPIQNIRVADALDDNAFRSAAFDAVIGNPPYVNIRQLARSLPAGRFKQLRTRYQTARGNFDLYVLFIELAIKLLRPGGRCGLVVPNKWATLDYACACRKLLLETTAIEHVIDLSDAGAFRQASVYPHMLVFQKQPAKPNHAVRFQQAMASRPLHVPQRSLSPAAFHLSQALAVESRVTTIPLGQVATLACGTAGYAAQKIAARLVDSAGASENQRADFITSGNVDRYQIRLGNVRYLNRDYCRPRLLLDSPELTPAKRQLFTSPKIVIAGMSRRLEAVWDDRGLALGVQVFAAHQLQLDPFYLLALINSKLLSYLFATRYAAKRLGGGYLAINKGQLSQLPIRIIKPPTSADAWQFRRLSHLAANWNVRHEAEIDTIVYQLYRLSGDEITRVEAHFAERRAIAA